MVNQQKVVQQETANSTVMIICTPIPAYIVSIIII